MSYHFQVGQQVVCVDDEFPRNPLLVGFGHQYPVKGCVYTVRETLISRGEPCVLLNEILNPVLHYVDGIEEGPFRASRFRPVRTTNIEIFERLLAPSPKELEKCR